MALICDTGGIFGLYDADDVHHEAIKQVIEREAGPLFVPVILLAEIDYLLTTRLSQDAGIDFLESVDKGAFLLVPFLADDVHRCLELTLQYKDLQLGVSDAAVVSAAEKMGIARLLSLDERHFRAIKPRGLGHFVLLPKDDELPKRNKSEKRKRR